MYLTVNLYVKKLKQDYLNIYKVKRIFKEFSLQTALNQYKHRRTHTAVSEHNIFYVNNDWHSTTKREINKFYNNVANRL